MEPIRSGDEINALLVHGAPLNIVVTVHEVIEDRIKGEVLAGSHPENEEHRIVEGDLVEFSIGKVVPPLPDREL